MTAATDTHNRRLNERRGDQPEVLIRDADRILTWCGVGKSGGWVLRTVRQYLHHAAPKGMPFGAYLLHRVELTAEQRRRAMANPDTQYLLCYSDPTGETAVRNVMRRHG